VKNIANTLQESGFQVKSILSPTVPKGKERLRFCLHSYNTEAELKAVIHTLQKLQACKTISIQ
jgi:8-amino-7-oxononanoate synthase